MPKLSINYPSSTAIYGKTSVVRWERYVQPCLAGDIWKNLQHLQILKLDRHSFHFATYITLKRIVSTVSTPESRVNGNILFALEDIFTLKLIRRGDIWCMTNGRKSFLLNLVKDLNNDFSLERRKFVSRQFFVRFWPFKLTFEVSKNERALKRPLITSGELFNTLYNTQKVCSVGTIFNPACFKGCFKCCFKGLPFFFIKIRFSKSR